MLRKALAVIGVAGAVVLGAADGARAQAGAWGPSSGEQLGFSFHLTGQGIIHGEDKNVRDSSGDPTAMSKLWSPGFGMRLEVTGRMVRGISGHVSIGYIEHRGDEDFVVGPPFTGSLGNDRYHRLQQVPLLIGLGIHPLDFSGQRVFDLFPRVDVGISWTSDVDVRMDTVPGSEEDLEVYRPTTQFFVGVGGGVTLRLGRSPWFVGAELTYRLYSRLRGARFLPGQYFRSSSAIGALQGGFYVGVWV
jgi:hypothetical protein